MINVIDRFESITHQHKHNPRIVTTTTTIPRLLSLSGSVSCSAFLFERTVGKSEKQHPKPYTQNKETEIEANKRATTLLVRRE
jgi:hypothetical protein